MTMSSSSRTAKNEGVARTERAQQYLAGTGVLRDDSDDELGLEDLPWEWIYASDKQTGLGSDGDGADARNGGHQGQRTIIIGARMGKFECFVGDCVLLKAEGNNEAWVGLICEFLEDDDDEMVANFMWFSTEKEIRNKAKKRTDFLQNELYITPSWDHNPLASINGKATILSAKAYHEKYPTGRIPRSSSAFGKVFICRRGCNTRTATYTDEFIWNEIFTASEESIHSLIQRVKNETKATRKRKSRPDTEKDIDDLNFETRADDDDLLRTPKKRRKNASTGTPQKARTPSKLLTPSHKRIVIKKALEFTPLGTRILSPTVLQSSPFQAARSRLHVSAVPASLPCREAEFSEVYSHLETAITDGVGSCIYISGTPGTGKTATVREVVAQLNASVLAEELDDFIFVEINGMKVTDPHQSYSLLWEALKGDRVSPTQALDLLEREFTHPSPRRVPCVVLMDELDQLVTRNQSVMYNFFNWPGMRHSRLIVLAVANTMDLPERTLSNKISSRLGMHRITFGGYTHEQLQTIITSRLSGVPGAIVDPDAIQFAARKVAAVSGDARRALDICRRAVELAESESADNEPLLTSPSKRPPADDKVASKLGKVTIATIKRAINEATSSPLQQHLKGLPLSGKVLLAALLAKCRRTGLMESVLGEVIEEAKRIAKMAIGVESLRYLLEEIAPGSSSGRNTRVPGNIESVRSGKENEGLLVRKVPRVLALGSAAVELMEAGIIGVETRRGDRIGKIRLCIGEEDVKLAFREDKEAKGLGF